MMRIFAGFLVVLVGTLLGGCSTFEQRWKEAPGGGEVSALQPVQGRWAGKWASDKGHGGGGLRAVIVATQAPSTATGSMSEKYSATFKATWGGIFSGDYTVDLITQPANVLNRTAFTGVKDLGTLAGGVYTFEGWVAGDDFYATYTASGDQGKFVMKRVR